MITHQFKCQSHNRSGSRHIILSYRNRENIGSLQLRAMQGPMCEPIRTSLINLCFWTKYCILMNQLLINGLSMSRIPGTCWTPCNLFPACTYFLTLVSLVWMHIRWYFSGWLPNLSLLEGYLEDHHQSALFQFSENVMINLQKLTPWLITRILCELFILWAICQDLEHIPQVLHLNSYGVPFMLMTHKSRPLGQ